MFRSATDAVPINHDRAEERRVDATADHALQTVCTDNDTFDEFRIYLAGPGVIGLATLDPALGALALTGSCFVSTRRRRHPWPATCSLHRSPTRAV
jgi:hypothetical protein